MKLHENTRDVTVSGEKTTSDFKIATSSKAFKILSDGIYSDKILAIIRELSTNAYDSHIEADNTSTPFDVHLPWDIEPWFSVRDYGTGMTKDKIETLYTTYFDSDRNKSNDFTGALGLGSKSPFAYTDSFTVESHLDGQKFIYNCFVNNNGQPQVALLFEGETDLHNGVEVKFPVSSRDFSEFYNKAPVVFYSFETKPTLTGKSVDLPPKKIVISGNGWEIVNRGGFRTNAFAIQGNVAYYINSSSIPESMARNDIVNLINGMNIDIHFPMGSLDVSASRESLGYDNTTSQNVYNRACEVIEELQAMVDSVANKSKNYWDAVLNVSKFDNNVRHLRLNTVIPTTFFRGKKIKIGKTMRFDLPVGETICYKFKYSDSISRETSRNSIYFNFGEKPLVVVDDEGKETNRKCLMKTRSYFKRSNYDRVWIIDGNSWKKSYKKDMNNLTVMYSTKLPKPEYDRKPGDKSYQKTIVDIKKAWTGNDFVNHTQVNFDEFALYVEVKNGRYVYDDNLVTIDEYLSFLDNFGFENIKLYGVKKTETSKKRFKNSKWRNIVDFVSEQVKIVAHESMEDLQALKTIANNDLSYKMRGVFTTRNANLIVDKNSKFFHVMNDVSKLVVYSKRFSDDTSRNKVRLLSRLASSFGVEIDYENFNLDDKVESFIESYPLIQGNSNMPSEAIVEYINAVDMYRSKK